MARVRLVNVTKTYGPTVAVDNVSADIQQGEFITRAEAFKELAKKSGVTIKDMYWTLGRHDIVAICDAPDDTSGGSGGTWGLDDTIVFAAPTSARAGLQQVSAYGGTPQVFAAPDPAEEGGLGAPAFIPGTDTVMFTTRLTKAGVPPSVVVRSLAAGRQQKLVLDGARVSNDELARGPISPPLSRPQYSRTGHLVVRSGATIVAVPFRPDTWQITGPVVPLVEAASDFSVSAGGRLVYVRAPSYGGQLVWVDRRGKAESLGLHDGYYSRPRLSPAIIPATARTCRCLVTPCRVV